MSDLTPEERVRRVKAALAEAGYPDADARWGPSHNPQYPGKWCVVLSTSIPPDVRWKARVVVGEGGHCWPCWSAHWVHGGPRTSCDHDPLTAPWPEVVR